MNNNLEKVTIASIEEGKFLQDINEALAAIQAQTIEFSDRHKARAKNAKTKLVIEIQIGCISPDDGAFAFATQIKKVLPSEPANVTLAMAGATEGGKMALFARPSGTGRDTRS